MAAPLKFTNAFNPDAAGGPGVQLCLRAGDPGSTLRSGRDDSDEMGYTRFQG